MTANTCHVCGSAHEVQIVPNCVLYHRQPYCGECIRRRTESEQDVIAAIDELGLQHAMYDLTVWSEGRRVGFEEWIESRSVSEDRV